MLLTNILLIALFIVISGGFISIWLKYRKISRSFREFITPPAENELSPLGMSINAISSEFSRSIVAQAKTTFMANTSALARGEKTVEADIAQDMLTGSNPLIAGIVNQFPTLTKSLRRNPALMNLALSKLAGMKFPGGNNSPPSGQVQFKM